MKRSLYYMTTLAVLVVAGGVFWAIFAVEDKPVYDPMAVSVELAPEVVDLEVHDSRRQRNIPIRVYMASAKELAPVILFSHGLGGSREGSAYLGKHWAAHGYVAVFLQHPGSDESVWRGDSIKTEKVAAMREAANLRNFLWRVQDVPVVLDQLDVWNKKDEHVLEGRMNMGKIGMSGHSFGAITTQAVSGQRSEGGKEVFTDPRIVAAVAMSPSSPVRGTPQAVFGKVSLPWMLMTGTKDTSLLLGVGAGLESRFAVFAALPSDGNKYELVLHNAEHSVFTERALPGDREPRNPNHHRVILALSTAFWDAYLRDDPAAREFLQGEGAKSVLEKEDSWQRK